MILNRLRCFIGYAKNLFEKQDFSSGNNIYNIDGGFRYLVSRSFGLRTGMDIAKSTDDWGWYIVYGHNWNR